MELNLEGWKEFRIGQMFDIHPTRDYKGMSNDELNDGGTIPFVINSAENNAIGGFSTLPATEKGGIITFSDTTDGNTFFYQPDDFIGFAHVQGMYPVNHDWNDLQMLFLVSVLMFHNRGLFNYGRKMRRDTIAETFVKLPIRYGPGGAPVIDPNRTYSDEGFVPDWQFMEDYIRSLHFEPLTTGRVEMPMAALCVDEWEAFKVSDLFRIIRGKTLSADDKDEYRGSIPCINGTSENNGILCYLNEEIDLPKVKAPALSLSRVGNSGMTFYQDTDFYIADNAFGLILKTEQVNKVYLFLSTVLNQELFKYSYGRTISSAKYLNTVLKLPIRRDHAGNPVLDDKHVYSERGYIPDWRFMEDYMNSLPYSDRI